MQKLFKRSLAMLLAIMMVLTMFAGAMADTTDLADFQLRSCDDTGWQNSPRGEFFKDSTTYTEGTGSIRIGLDKRGVKDGSTKIMNAWLGSIDDRNENTDTLDITNAINANGEFYITMDLWIDPAKVTELNAGRFRTSIACYNDAQAKATDNLDQSSDALMIDKAAGAKWSVWGLDSVQAGWNHLAAKVTGVNGICNFGTQHFDLFWDASKIWGIKFNYSGLEWEDPEDFMYNIRVDDIRFMSVEAYEATFASRNKVKDVISAIAEIENKNDVEKIAATREAYAALTEDEKAQVVNYPKLHDIDLVVDQQLKNCEGPYHSGDDIMIPGGNFVSGDIPTLETERYTEGAGAAYVQFKDLTEKKLHISFLNKDQWDFSKATYLAFDMYVHGFKPVWTPGNGDQNIGFGDEASWESGNLGWIGNSTMQTLVSSKLHEGWNHVVVPIPATAQVNGVKSIRMYFEYCLEFTADDPFAIFDDVRILNENGLLNDQVRTQAKDVIALIGALSDPLDTEAITAAKEAYEALTDEQKTWVNNYDRIAQLEQAAIDGKAVTDKIAAVTGGAVTVEKKFNPLDSTDKIVNVQSTYFSAAVDAENKQEGTGAVKFSMIGTNGIRRLDVILRGEAVNITEYDNIVFDLYISEGVEIFDAANTSPACALLLSDVETTATSGTKIKQTLDLTQFFKGLSLQAGQWNTISIPADLVEYDGDVMQLRFRLNCFTTEKNVDYFVMDNLRLAKIVVTNEITYAHKDAVEALRAEYDALSDDAKKAVTNLATLEAMEDIIGAEVEAAAAVDALIEALPTPTDVITLNDKPAVVTARNAYDALAEATKNGVTKYGTLLNAEAIIKMLEENATPEDLAAPVNSAIEALPAPADVVVDNESAINVADQLYTNLAPLAKEFVTPENVAKLEAVKAALAEEKAYKAAADVVVAQIAQLPTELTLDDKAAVDAAQDAYEDLEDGAKKYVSNKAVLDAAVETIAKMAKDAADANAVEELVNALPETVTLDDKAQIEAAKAAYDALSADAKELLSAEIVVALNTAVGTLASLQPYDVQFRGFEDKGDDYNCEAINEKKATGGQKTDMPIEGGHYVFAEYTKEDNRVLLYVYGYKQNHQNDAEGKNPDGCSKIFLADVNDMYVSFDFYVSDASVVNGTVGDCGFNIDTKEGGGPNKWGNTFAIRKNVVAPALQALKDGWNHIVLPLSFAKESLAATMTGTYITVDDFRFHISGINVPVGFYVGLDDIRFMNGMAVEQILPQRSAAKDVTSAIRAYDADNGTYDDFYKIYVAYNALGDEYKEIVLGWDAFIADKAEWVAQAETDMAKDQQIADEVIAQIKALPAVITVDDEAAIKAAQDAYDELSEEQQLLVGFDNITALNNAQKALEEAKKIAADKAAAAAVDALIKALPAPADVAVDNEEAIKAARGAYDALTAAQKEYVEGLETLEAIEAALAVAKDKAAAAAVDAMIEALPTPTDVTAEDAEAINAAMDAYNALTAAQKEYVTLADKLFACVDKLEEVSAIKMGDLDGDGKIDAKDALVALKIAVQKVVPTDAQTVAGDVDENGKIDAVDALEMLKFAVKKPSVLDKFNPVEEA